MFENLSGKLFSIFEKLRKSGKLTEADIDAALGEVKIALLEADVNFRVVKQFMKRVKDKAVGQEILGNLKIVSCLEIQPELGRHGASLENEPGPALLLHDLPPGLDSAADELYRPGHDEAGQVARPFFHWPVHP